MTVLELGALGLGALLVIVFVIVPWVTRPASVEVRGENETVITGAIWSFLGLVAALYVMNPDHLASVRGRAVEAAVLAAAGAVVWLPVYLVAVKGRLRGRRRGGEE